VEIQVQGLSRVRWGMRVGELFFAGTHSSRRGLYSYVPPRLNRLTS
jgi:hypothetical protein